MRRMMLPGILLAVLVYSNLSAPAAARATTIEIPATNEWTGMWAVGDGYLAYPLADPRLQPHAPLNDRPFTNFVAHLYLVRIAANASGEVHAHVILSGPRGVGLFPHQIAAGWLLLDEARADNPYAAWTSLARNLRTGRSIVLDSERREGLPSLSSREESDGRTVVWSSWTLRHGQPTSVVRTYNLTTGRRTVVAEGGSPNTWSYLWPAVSGRWVVFEKDMLSGRTPHEQILLADLTTGRVRALTPPSQANSEPSMARSLIAWKVGQRFGGGAGVMTYDVRTGVRRLVFRGTVEQPQVVAGDQVVFPTACGPCRIERYDARSGRSSTIAGPAPTADGYAPGNAVAVGGHMVAYALTKSSTTLIPNPLRIVVVTLP